MMRAVIKVIDHPGKVMQEKMNSRGMSRKELALRTGVTEKHICTILNGNKGISTGFARKLGYVFEDTIFWMNLQAQYDSAQLRLQEENEVTQEEKDLLKPLHEIVSYLSKRKHISGVGGEIIQVLELREFLQISNLTQIPKITYNAAYRAQLTSNVKVDPYVLFAWQRMCEVETEIIQTKENLNKDILRNSVSIIRNAMFGNINTGIRDLQGIFAECGIAFQVVKNFRGAPVQGFIKESGERLILCLTIRGKRADRFWFTLFHEIAHILNDDYKMRFVDFDSVSGKAEEIADQYARDILIPSQKYRNFIMSRENFTWNDIQVFAETIKVQPFIVLGRLQNDGILDWSDYSDKVLRYEWA